jgi:uncharacterized phage protein gp47/JayE
MILKKNFGELVLQSLSYLKLNTNITNTNVGGITRSIIEIINKNIAEYYDVLDTNMTMSFLSSAEGYFLDLIGEMFNMQRIPATPASATVADGVQKFYSSYGTLFDYIPTGVIPINTVVSSSDGTIVYAVASDTVFSASATEVYVPIKASTSGSSMNVGLNILTVHNLGISNVFTTNVASIVSGTDTESDSNYRYRLMNATQSAERANEIAVRLAALSVDGVADVVMKPYYRGIGTYGVIVIPVQGLAGDQLVAQVQAAIESVQAYGIGGTAMAPGIVPVNIEVRLSFVNGVTDYTASNLKAQVVTAIKKYILSIPLGGDFIFNEMGQQIMDVSPSIKDYSVTCYFFRDEPVFLGNVSIYSDEIFYPDPSVPDPIRAI